MQNFRRSYADSCAKPSVAYHAEVSDSEPIYSIGAVSRMLGVPAATLRAWEDRYGVVVPERSDGGQRLYTRSQIEQLQFIQGVHAVGRERGGRAPRPARSGSPQGQGYVAPDQGDSVLVLLAERDPFAAELAEYLLRTEGYEVILALDAAESRAPVRGPPAGDRRAGPHDLGWAWCGAVQDARSTRVRASSRCRRFRNATGRSRPARTPSCASRSSRSSWSPRCATCSERARLRTNESARSAS